MKAIFKKLLFVCFGIVFAMLVSFGASAAAIPGDVNDDSEVNIRDAASVLLYANGKPVECVNDVVDANGDGVIDQNDAQTLLESITGHEDVVLNTGDACEHELSFVEGKERGTCPESGLSEHWVCSKCSKIFKDEDATILTNTAGVTIEPIHISGEWKEEVPATKTENGLKVIRCQSCKTLLDSEVIPYTGSVGLEYTLNTDGNSYSVSGIGTCTDTEIAIPSTYEGLPVTGIGDEAFSGCSQLVSVIMPDSIILVRSLAFDYCTNLMNVDFSDSITALGVQAFGNCASLTYIDLPKNLKHFNSHVFIGCTNLKSITIPENVEYIDEWAVFSYCPSIESIVVDENNKYYHSQNNCLIDTKNKVLIYGCKNSIIPNDGSVTSLSDFAFAGCSELKSITIPASVTNIGTLAFGYCTGLETIVVEEGNPVFSSSGNCLILTATKEIILGCKKSIIPTDESVTKIGSSAFEYCTGLTSITIPGNIISIGSYAFSECSSLTNIVIPNSVTSIGAGAFEKCSSLTSITIPNSVKSIGNNAFFYCKNLSSFTFDGTAEEWEKVEKGKNWNDGCPFTEVKFTKVSASQGLEFYLNEDGQSYTVSGIGTCTDTEIVIPEIYEGLPVTKIGNSAFKNCLSLTSIAIPNSVTRIGSFAFEYCYNLTSITIPNSVTSIGSDAFYYCYNLTSITIPNSVASIGNQAFSRCSSLTSVTIPNSVTSIGVNAFASCPKLENIVVEEGNVVYHSYNNCLIETASKTLILGCKNSIIPTDGSVTSIGRSAFNGCSSLTSVTIPDSVTSIGRSAFNGCSSLSSFTFDGTAEEWEKVEKGADWNYNCPFTEVIFTKISELAFTLNEDGQSYTVSGIGTCTDTEIVIPEIYEGLPVTRIGDEAFYNCSIIGITIPDSVTSIGDEAFSYCPELKSLYITNKVTYIGSHAFVACSEMESIVVEPGNTFYHSDNNCLIETASKKLIVGCQNSVIPTDGSVTSIGDLAFSWSNLSSINIPDCITSIGKEAFSFNYFDSINIPDSITSIGDYAFVGCYFLTNVDMPNGITNIGEMMFYGCANLTSITIPNSVTSIGYEAFYECTSLSTFIFDGTAEEWEKVEKGADWNYGCPFTEVIFTKESHIHNFIHVEAKEPTCYENGNIEYWYCSECDWMELEGGIATNKKAVTLPASHNLKIVMTQNASCTRPGLLVQECSVCKSIIYDTLDMLPHTESDWITDIEPTDTKDGHRYKSCTVCGQTVASEIILRPGATEHEHSIVTNPAIDATCAPGKTEGKHCEICGAVIVPQEDIPPVKGHEYALVSSIPPSCTTSGYQYFHCLFCGVVKSQEMPPAPHGFSDWTIVHPTATKDGYKSRTCMYCGLVEKIILEATGSEGLAYTLNEDGQSYTVSGIGTCTDTEIVIPSTYEGKPVTSIGEVAFANNTSITSVVVPNGVTIINTAAFRDCTLLQSVEIPESVTMFGAFAFTGCKNLTTVNIPYGTEEIAFRMFESCSSLTNITLPDTIEYIGEWAFCGCNLTSINIPKGVSDIGQYAFQSCDFSSVEIPDGVTSIQGYTFLGCKNLESVKIPNSVTSIGEGAFQSCVALKDLTIPESVTSIGICAFYDCQSLTSIVIPKNVTSMGMSAFEMCTKLESVTIEYGVTNISKYMFGCCYSLTSISIPNSVTSIGDSAFISCSSLTEINIPNSVTSLGSYVFGYITNINNINIPNSVTSIGAGTLSCFASIDNIVFEEGNTAYHIDGNCIIETATKTLIVGFNNSVISNDGSVTIIAGGAFSGRSDLQSIIIPDCVTYIGSSAFSECRSLSAINIPEGVTSIEESTFYNCYNLTSITIPNSVKYIKWNVFSSCYNLSNFMFVGTTEEWEKVEKSYNWQGGSYFSIIHCTDGDVSVN